MFSHIPIKVLTARVTGEGALIGLLKYAENKRRNDIVTVSAARAALMRFRMVDLPRGETRR